MSYTGRPYQHINNMVVKGLCRESDEAIVDRNIEGQKRFIVRIAINKRIQIARIQMNLKGKNVS